jgi:hypothetical protein
MSRKAVSTFAALFLFLQLPILSGCGSQQPTVARVHGRIIYQGKPVAVGQIMFYPETGRPAIGTIGPDGAYKLTTFPDKSGDGALLGKHRVTIESTRMIGGMQPKSVEDESRAFRGGIPRIEWLVPEIFSQLGTTPLKAEVKPGENTIDFDLSATFSK